MADSDKYDPKLELFVCGLLVPQDTEQPLALAYFRNNYSERLMHKMFKDALHVGLLANGKVSTLDRYSGTDQITAKEQLFSAVGNKEIQFSAITYDLPAKPNHRANFWLMRWGQHESLMGNVLFLGIEKRPRDMKLRSEHSYYNFPRHYDIDDVMGPFGEPVYIHGPG